MKKITITSISMLMFIITAHALTLADTHENERLIATSTIIPQKIDNLGDRCEFKIFTSKAEGYRRLWSRVEDGKLWYDILARLNFLK